MKIKSLRIKINCTTIPKSSFKAELYDGKVIADVSELSQNNIMLGFRHTVYCEITSYVYSPATNQMFERDYNTLISYNCTIKGKEEEFHLLTKLNWWKRQKLYLMMGDHMLVKDGNFKWFVTTVLAVLVFLYTIQQNYKLVESWKENSRLKDQIHKLETKIAKDEK